MRSESRVQDIHRTVMKSACVVMLTACNPIKIPSPDAVGGDPDRTRELMRQCKADWAKVGDATCRAATESWRRRFMGIDRGASAARSPASSTGIRGLPQ
jgi:hypothetical protein